MFYSHLIRNKKGTYFLASLFILIPCLFHPFSSNSQRAQSLNFFAVQFSPLISQIIFAAQSFVLIYLQKQEINNNCFYTGTITTY